MSCDSREGPAPREKEHLADLGLTAEREGTTLEGADIRVNEPVFDPLAVMGWLGARTKRVRLGFSVLVIPYRNPVVMADRELNRT